MLASRPLRILVVDDDPAMVGAITALVGTEGHQVITAYDGLTAVRRYREERPDIVLLDLAMPGPDGFTVAGRIRAEGDAPIVVVSGESSEEAKVRALGIGADDYLVKPFGRAELLARIVGPKGKDYTNHDTAQETLVRTSLMVDVGQVVASRKGTVFVGVGYEYWHNKYGNPPGVGTQVNAPQFQLEWHL